MNRFRHALGEKQSEGVRRTWIALRRRGWGFADLSAAIGRERGAVNRWLWADRSPDIAGAAAIETLLKIPARLWAEPPAEAIEDVLPPVRPTARIRPQRSVRQGARG